MCAVSYFVPGFPRPQSFMYRLARFQLLFRIHDSPMITIQVSPTESVRAGEECIGQSDRE